MSPDELEPMSPSMRALLDAERPLDEVPAATRAKLYAKVTVTVAGLTAAAAGGGIAAAAATGGKAAAVGTSVATATTVTATAKVMLIAAVAFSVGGGVGATVHAVVAKPAQAPAPIVVRMEAPVVVAPEPVLAPPAETPVPPKPVVVAPSRAAASNLDAERSMVEQARTALSRNDTPAALAVLREHERTYPAGQLAEERMALTVLALSQNGEHEKARQLAARFRAKHPRSLLMPAVDNASPP